MKYIRVHELAKDYGMQGKDLAKLLRDLGFEQVKSNLSVLDDGDLMMVEARLWAHGLKRQPAGAEAAAAPAKKKLLSADAATAAAAAEAPAKMGFFKKALSKAPAKKTHGKKAHPYSAPARTPYPNITQLKVKQVEIKHKENLPVYYLAYYWPKSHVQRSQQEDTIQLLRLKNRDSAAARHFASKLKPALKDASNIIMVAMPSSEVGCASFDGGLRQVIRLTPGAVDLSARLVRHTAVQKSSTAPKGQRPTREDHEKSMRAVDPERLQNLDIILLDDVVTLGATMLGARSVLLTAGARSVTCLSLTRTASLTERP